MTTTLKIVGKVKVMPNDYEIVGNVTNYVIDFGNLRDVSIKNSQLIRKKHRCIGFAKTKTITQTDAICTACRTSDPCAKDKVIPVLILEK